MSIYAISWETEEVPAQECLHVFFLKARKDWLEHARQVLRHQPLSSFSRPLLQLQRLPSGSKIQERQPESYSLPALLPLTTTLWRG